MQFDAPKDGELNVSVFNVSGQAVQEFKISAVQGFNEFTMDKATLNNGVYIVSLSDGSARVNAKVVKY